MKSNSLDKLIDEAIQYCQHQFITCTPELLRQLITAYFELERAVGSELSALRMFDRLVEEANHQTDAGSGDNWQWAIDELRFETLAATVGNRVQAMIMSLKSQAITDQALDLYNLRKQRFMIEHS